MSNSEKIEDLKLQIQVLVNKLQVLLKEEELANLPPIPDEETCAIADILHEAFCRYYHESECSWYEDILPESWVKDSTRKLYIMRAKVLIEYANRINVTPISLANNIKNIWYMHT